MNGSRRLAYCDWTAIAVFIGSSVITRIPFHAYFAHLWDSAESTLVMPESNVVLSQPHAAGLLL